MTDLPRMIGLTGYSRVGKDTLGELLVEHHGYHQIAFATPLYNILLALNPPLTPVVRGLSGLTITTVQKLLDKHGGSWRAAKDDPFYGPELIGQLQRLASEGCRAHLGEDVFVDAAQRAIDKQGWWRVVVTDVRFPNETAWVRRCGGIVVRIQRPGVGPVNAHVADSGQGALDVDMTIINDTTPKAMLLILEERWSARPSR